jgi:hypothetical protein
VTGGGRTIVFGGYSYITAERLDTPTHLIATAVTPNRVDLTWEAIASASWYEIDRKAPGDEFTMIATSSGNAFSDENASLGTAYLYQVRAAAASGISGNSLPDLATTVIFSDSGLSAGAVIKAAHCLELRKAANAVRSLADLPPAAFAEAALVGRYIRTTQVSELRSAIASARAALGLSRPDYEFIFRGFTVKAQHFLELRSGTQ